MISCTNGTRGELRCHSIRLPDIGVQPIPAWERVRCRLNMWLLQHSTVLCRYPGGLKERTATQVHDKDPSEILRRAVSGMLPKNILRKVNPGTDTTAWPRGLKFSGFRVSTNRVFVDGLVSTAPAVEGSEAADLPRCGPPLQGPPAAGAVAAPAAIAAGEAAAVGAA